MIHSKIAHLRRTLDKSINKKVSMGPQFLVDIDRGSLEYYILDISNNLQNIYKVKYTLINY